jgi:hypothetical protein
MSNQRAYRRSDSWLVLLVLGTTALGSALAQQSPAPSAAPPPEQLEPGVDTSKITTEKPAPDAASESASPAPATTRAGSTARGAAGNSAPRASSSAAAAAPAAAAQTAAAPTAAARAKKGPDRLELEATDITGNRELPKVLYIVPWKPSDLGDLVGKPTNSLLDEVLQPLDRDVFQRENRYYDALKTEAAPAAAPAATLSGGKP